MCVWDFFSERWQSTLFEIFFFKLKDSKEEFKTLTKNKTKKKEKTNQNTFYFGSVHSKGTTTTTKNLIISAEAKQEDRKEEMTKALTTATKPHNRNTISAGLFHSKEYSVVVNFETANCATLLVVGSTLSLREFPENLLRASNERKETDPENLLFSSIGYLSSAKT